MTENNNLKEAPKSFLDYNASWPLTLVYLGFLIGIYFAQQYSMKFISDWNGYAYYFISIIGGVIGTFLIYNLGKIVFAKICGYRILYIKLLGLTLDKADGKKTKVSYDIMDFFTIGMQFVPEDDDTKKNPTLLFFGGIIFETIILILAFVFFFVFSMNQRSLVANFGWTFLFAACYGFLTPLYEMLPFRQDYPTDMYNCMMTRKEEDRIAFNIFQINKKREMTGEDFTVPSFEEYNSFYKLHTLYYLYLQDLYESKLTKASEALDRMKYFSKYYLEDERYLPLAETVYLKFLVDDEPGANKVFLSIKKDERKNVTNPSDLAGFRTAVLVLANIHSDKEAIDSLTKSYEKKLQSLTLVDSYRVKREKALFESAYQKARTMKSDLNLPERSN